MAEDKFEVKKKDTDKYYVDEKKLYGTTRITKPDEYRYILVPRDRGFFSKRLSPPFAIKQSGPYIGSDVNMKKPSHHGVILGNGNRPKVVNGVRIDSLRGNL